MAVIRAKQLWHQSVPAAYPGTALYTVPVGKRAIVRSMAWYMEDFPPDVNPAPYASISVSRSGGPWLVAWWAFFLPEWVGGAMTVEDVRPWRGWSGQLVLHSGDAVSWEHSGEVGNFTTWGAGHELNEVT